jgi:hypothetical protein
MWRTILVSKNKFQSIQSPKFLLNISFKNTQVSSSRLLYIYPLNNPIKNSINTNFKYQFARTIVSNSENPNQKSLKEPLYSTSEPKKKSKYDLEQIKKLFAVFGAGVVAYFALSYVLDMKDGSKKSSQTSNEDVINYESKNLPDKVKISKSVSIIF